MDDYQVDEDFEKEFATNISIQHVEDGRYIFGRQELNQTEEKKQELDCSCKVNYILNCMLCLNTEIDYDRIQQSDEMKCVHDEFNILGVTTFIRWLLNFTIFYTLSFECKVIKWHSWKLLRNPEGLLAFQYKLDRQDNKNGEIDTIAYTISRVSFSEFYQKLKKLAKNTVEEFDLNQTINNQLYDMLCASLFDEELRKKNPFKQSCINSSVTKDMVRLSVDKSKQFCS